MSDILDTVRRLVGRRHKITREEMRDILAELPHIADHSTITGRDQHGELVVGQVWVKPIRIDAPDLPPSMREIDRDATYAAEQHATATAWANACKHITCISVLAYGDGTVGVRYDQPGSMHPMQHALLTFVPGDIDAGRSDGGSSIDYMRRHADRVLLVGGEPLATEPEPEPEAEVAPWIARLRKDPRIDGTWTRLLDDGTLEMRDPNDGQSMDLAHKARYQYAIDDSGYLLYRVMPPESVGDAWEDIGVPEWEMRDPYRVPEVVRDYWEAAAL